MKKRTTPPQTHPPKLQVSTPAHAKHSEWYVDLGVRETTVARPHGRLDHKTHRLDRVGVADAGRVGQVGVVAARDLMTMIKKKTPAM